jgi:hypothetical protein
LEMGSLLSHWASMPSSLFTFFLLLAILGFELRPLYLGKHRTTLILFCFSYYSGRLSSFFAWGLSQTKIFLSVASLVARITVMYHHA